jgi:hypothetical protein
VSPTEDFFCDPALQVLSRLQLHGSGFDGVHAPFDRTGPCSVSIMVRRAIKARQQLSSHFGARIEIEAQGACKNGFNGLGHAANLTPGVAEQQAAPDFRQL